ncbi:MAG: CoA-binding protein [Desulfovibrionaceae bacterium]|nr:CoA-binding protein [Desulfovibrionaceae bacterium]
MFDAVLRTLLCESHSIALVGAKDKAGQPVDAVGRYLIAAGYRVYPVHPVRQSVWGLQAYPCLAALPCPVDIINLFRAPEACLAHAHEVLALPWRPRAFWMQQGIRSPEAGRLLAQQGILVQEDLCIQREHQRLIAPTIQGL